MDKLPLFVRLVNLLMLVEDTIDMSIALREDRTDVINDTDYELLLCLRSSLGNVIDSMFNALNSRNDLFSSSSLYELKKLINNE